LPFGAADIEATNYERDAHDQNSLTSLERRTRRAWRERAASARRKATEAPAARLAGTRATHVRMQRLESARCVLWLPHIHLNPAPARRFRSDTMITSPMQARLCSLAMSSAFETCRHSTRNARYPAASIDQRSHLPNSSAWTTTSSVSTGHRTRRLELDANSRLRLCAGQIVKMLRRRPDAYGTTFSTKVATTLRISTEIFWMLR
jgi:hypothetical protein